MLTVKEIAEKTGKTTKAVHKILSNHGVKPLGRNPHGENLFDDTALETAGRRVKGPARYYKVSVRNSYSQWIVKAVCLSKKESMMISDELNAVGFTARATSHSFGVKSK